MKDGELYKEFIKTWNGKIGVVDRERAVAWMKFLKLKSHKKISYKSKQGCVQYNTCWVWKTIKG